VYHDAETRQSNGESASDPIRDSAIERRNPPLVESEQE